MKKRLVSIKIITSALLCAITPTTAQFAPTNAEVFRSLLKTINFEINSTELTQSSYAGLDNISALFIQNQELRYEIQGHSDSIGDVDYNKLLSGARAGTVKNYIVSQGVSEANIIAIGYGSERPIANNSTRDGRAANRRVEILLIESQEKYEDLKNRETQQREDIIKAGIVTIDHEPEPESEPQPEPVIETVECEPCLCPSPEPCIKQVPVASTPQQKSKIKMSIGAAGFFSTDFGGGFSTPEININNNIEIPGAKTKTPWAGGGFKMFLDITTYAEVSIGLTFGGGTIEMSNPAAALSNESSTIKIDRSFTALNLSLFGKYPLKLELPENMTLFPAAGIDYQLVLSGKVGDTDIADAADDSALWFKFGAGMDITMSETIFIRPMLLYGIRRVNKWEDNAVRPVTTNGKRGSTLLGHGLTFSVGIGFTP